MESSDISELIAQYMEQIKAIDRLIPEIEQRRFPGGERQTADLRSMKSDLWFSIGLMKKYVHKDEPE